MDYLLLVHHTRKMKDPFYFENQLPNLRRISHICCKKRPGDSSIVCLKAAYSQMDIL